MRDDNSPEADVGGALPSVSSRHRKANARIVTIPTEEWASLPPLRGWSFPAQRLSRREWWVYFIQGDDGGPIKIGTTGHLLSRLAKVQTGYPFGELGYAGLLRSEWGMEQALHRRFANVQIRGEWFAPTDEIVAYVRLLPRST